MPRHLLALALGVCAGVAVMVVAAHGIALSRMLYLLAGLIFAGNLFAALAFDYWSMLAARFIAGLPHGAYFGVGAGCTPGLHARNMTFDETQLDMGVRVLTAAALKHVG